MLYITDDGFLFYRDEKGRLHVLYCMSPAERLLNGL